MSSAGFQLVAGRIPGERIATTVETSDSADFQETETVVASVTAPLVEGRTYEVWAIARWGSSASSDQIVPRIREDNLAGTLIQQGQLIGGGTSSFGYGPVPLYVEYTATATGDKTFVLTGDRNGGSGDCRLDATGGNPAYFFVNYNRG